MSEPADNYFLPKGYKSKVRNVTTADVRSEPYWNALRRSTARYWQGAVYTRARGALGKDKTKSVLDVGCGFAVKLATILAPAAARACGTDYGEVVEINKNAFPALDFSHVDFESKVATLAEMPVGLRSTFDVIVCADVIEHMFEPDLLLQKIRMWSHDGTRIFISTPERDALYGKPVLEARNVEHVREWNSEEFRKYLQSRGFAVQEIRLVRAMSFNFSRMYLMQWLSPNRGRYNMMADCHVAS